MLFKPFIFICGLALACANSVNGLNQRSGGLDNSALQDGPKPRSFLRNTCAKGGKGKGRKNTSSTASFLILATDAPTDIPSAVSLPAATTSPPPISAAPAENPTSPVPVSGAGGAFDPSAAAKAHQFDSTATRERQSVHIRSSRDGRCLSVDPTAGDFRQNFIPVGMAECDEEDARQKFDIVTKGMHNDGRLGKALVVSVLMKGCLSFDGRREKGDTVTMFSCGGRAAGGECRHLSTELLPGLSS